MTVQIDRGFVRVREGQVHYRLVGQPRPGTRPLVLLHASPSSSVSLQPFMRAMGEAYKQPLYAPDTLGNGDSCAAQAAVPDIAYYAEAVGRQLDALGIGEVDVYGQQTGSGIGTELAIQQPQRVRRLVVEGYSFYPPELSADMLANYADEIRPDAFGSQFHRIWQFLRDANFFFPWYKRDIEHQMKWGMPSPEYLHEQAVEVLKALTTYHHAYRASFRYDKKTRLPLVTQPDLLLYEALHPSLRYMEEALGAARNGSTSVLPASATTVDKARLVAEWLGR